MQLRTVTKGLPNPGLLLNALGMANSAEELRTLGQPKIVPVALMDMLSSLPENSEGKITLGLDFHNQPIQLNLLNNEVGNVLISGMKGAGKSSLLRAIGASVALQNRQSTLQLGVIDLNRGKPSRLNEGESLRALGQLPHSIFPVIRTVQGGLDVIDFLTDELNYRRDNKINNPLMVIIIDGIGKLLANADRVLYRKLGHLLNHGPDNGFRLFVSIEDPIAKDVRPLLKYDFPLRLLGRAADSDRAWAAAGIPGTGAEMLQGSGVFIAIRGDICRKFQSAYIDDNELRLVSRRIQNQRSRILLAHPASTNGSSPGAGGPHRVSGPDSRCEINGVANGRIEEESEWFDSSGSDGWLTADWLDRFWMDRN
jgi:DNA segregation ATPase FtsK/SpoIIIE-like protein